MTWIEEQAQKTIEEYGQREKQERVHQPVKLWNTTKIDRSEWLEKRQKGVGGSDVSVILGMNKYKSAWELWAEKTGRIDKPVVMNNAIYFGNELEDFVAKQFQKHTGFKVRRNNFMLQHPTHKHMLANLDREVILPNGELAVLEVKTTNFFGGKEWTQDGIPDAYLFQVMHYLAVTGLKTAFICVLIGGQQFEWYEIERNEDMINKLIEVEKDFWHLVETETEPEIQIVSEGRAEELLNLKFPADQTNKEDVFRLEDDLEDKLTKIEEKKAEMNELKEEVKDLENEVMLEMKEHEKAETSNFDLTWKGQKRNTFQTKEFKKEHPDLAEKFSKETWTKRSLKFKPKKGND